MTEDNIVKEQEALCRANPLVLNSLVYCYYQCNPHGNFCNVKQSIFLNWYLLIHVKLWSCHWKLRLCLVVSGSRGPRSIFPNWDQCPGTAVSKWYRWFSFSLWSREISCDLMHILLHFQNTATEVQHTCMILSWPACLLWLHPVKAWE